MLKPPPIALSFSASDSSGGAGTQADILTLASMGCHTLSVITAVTVQDTAGVNDVMVMDSRWVRDQAHAVLKDIPVQVFKIGMTGSVETITAISEIVSDYPEIPVVLDPVLKSSRGDELASGDMISAMCDLLLPQATIITPNSIEARRLVQGEVKNTDKLDHLDKCGERLLHMGCKYVLITDTHENSCQVINTLYSASGIVRSDVWQRLEGSYHGSGCTLASAIAASLAKGLSVFDGVYEAQEYTWQSLKAGFHPGRGQYLPNRLFWLNKENNSKEEDKLSVKPED